MWPTLAHLVRLTGAPLFSGAAAATAGNNTHVFIDGSAELARHAAAGGPARGLLRHLVAPHISRWQGAQSTCATLVFDASAIMPLHVPVPAESLAAEQRLLQSLTEARPFTADELEGAGTWAALDGSPLLQDPWLAHCLVPAVQEAARDTESWLHRIPGLRYLIVDRVVMPASFAPDAWERRAQDVMLPLSGSWMKRVTLDQDHNPQRNRLLNPLLQLRFMAQQLGESAGEHVRLCALPGRGGGEALVLRDDHPTIGAEAMVKVMRQVAALAAAAAAASSAEHAPDRVVVVSDRPDALLYWLVFLDAHLDLLIKRPEDWLQLAVRTTPGTEGEGEEGWVCFSVLEVARTLREKTYAEFRDALSQPYPSLLLLVAIAGGNEALGNGLWSAFNPQSLFQGPFPGRHVPPTERAAPRTRRVVDASKSNLKESLLWYITGWMKAIGMPGEAQTLVQSTSSRPEVNWHTFFCSARERDLYPPPSAQWAWILGRAAYLVYCYIPEAWRASAVQWQQRQSGMPQQANINDRNEFSYVFCSERWSAAPRVAEMLIAGRGTAYAGQRVAWQLGADASEPEELIPAVAVLSFKPELAYDRTEPGLGQRMPHDMRTLFKPPPPPRDKRK